MLNIKIEVNQQSVDLDQTADKRPSRPSCSKLTILIDYNKTLYFQSTLKKMSTFFFFSLNENMRFFSHFFEQNKISMHDFMY